MKTIPEQPQFFATLAREFPKVPPHFVARIGLKLIREARIISRLNENLCNIPEYQDTWEKKTHAARCRVRVLLVEFGRGRRKAAAIFGTDPRGASIKLVLPSGNTSNDWGKEGYCVPEGR